MAKVFLVGAGPGAADLLTLRAARAIGLADVLLADALVTDEVLALAKPTARVLRVGKRAGMKSAAQEFIHRAMARYARRGLTVARVKGGDPFVFGRGGEEMDYLRALGIEVEMIHGLTAGVAVAGAAGIPVTHRAHCFGVTMVTGHTDSSDTSRTEPDWSALAKSGTTLVIYMGLAALPRIAEHLVAGGLPRTTPAAVIAHGTLPTQQQVVGTLADIAERARAAALPTPALIVIGDVAAYAATRLADASPEFIFRAA
ncbi:uroporphyrinogen-III C-methyltransferase [Aromatoleum petrolei]|uniref:uroporphyrinogen-III C-methyltransferase n=1 Tax=Aromatoleum petrolei TaxID=76116 RepID=A0ABX1MGF6_9RHOO|nr:uroporphyrinogen-III C-methyltransferase [Aromatoleum petrolei]NMF86868.1 uroporphyrinogen-III C-methyltransferase [Aromatoleum petrolei]QTQ37457.1 putative uroporphyrin-III C-methyltransferase [Aromatoleum petrolei]